jgi:hypothetical protein
VSRAERVRFTFHLVDGPNAGLSCGGWRVWTHGEATYITAKALHDTWKVSLHGDEWWASSVTAENAERADTVLPPDLQRSVWRFQPTQFSGGRRLEFALGVFRHALLKEPTLDAREVIVTVPDSWDVLTLALVWMTEPDVDADPNWTLIGGPLPLSSGRRVWVTSSYDRVAPVEPQPIAVSTMIEPVTPLTHDVASPGWLVHGVHVS